MKRCPQCDFLYEDEQDICDMDGKLLVFDAVPDALDQAATLPVKRKSTWKLFGILAIPAFALGAFIPVAFHAAAGDLPEASELSKNANYSGPAEQVSSPVPLAAPAGSTPLPENNEPVEQESPLPEKETPTSKEPENENLRSMARANAEAVTRANAKAIGNTRAKNGGIQVVVVSSRRSGAFATQPVTPRREAQKPAVAAKTTSNVEKKDSKISSFLKNTGRILKRPFKL